MNSSKCAGCADPEVARCGRAAWHGYMSSVPLTFGISLGKLNSLQLKSSATSCRFECFCLIARPCTHTARKFTKANDMGRTSFGRKALWEYSHSFSILFAVLLFTAGFLCTLLWTNSLVQTESSASGPKTNTLNQFSPAVSTFSITYQVVSTLR